MPERERNRRLVDLSAIRHNVRVIRSLVPYSARLLAVVKADAYGHDYVRDRDIRMEQHIMIFHDKARVFEDNKQKDINTNCCSGK